MADNSTVNTGSADTGAVNEIYATDDIGGVKFPRSKIVIGADGVNGGDVSAANPMPVTAAAQPGVDIGDVTINNGSGASAVNIQDGGNTITVDGTVAVTGNIAHDSAASGNPVQIAGRASTATPSAVSADGDVCRLWASRLGALNIVVRDVAGDSCMDETNNAVQASIVKELPSGTQTIGSVKLTDGTDTADIIDADGYKGLVTVAPGHISAANSTATPLAGGATFTGTWEDSTNYGIVIVSIIASHASASSGFKVEFSSDGVNIDNDDSYTIPAATGKLYSFACAAKYVRVVYTNGATLQTYFRMQTMFKAAYAKPSSHRVGDQVSLEDDAELVKAVISGETTAGGGSMVNVKVNPSGALAVESSLAAGTNYVGKVRITDGTNDVTLLNLTNSKPVPTALVDGSGNQITSFGGGSQFAEDSAHVSGDIGTEILGVRRDVPVVGTSANGDYSTLSLDKFGHLRVVNPLSGPGSIDTFGHLITGQRNNQIDIQFYRGTPASLVTVTTTGSGAASSSGGGAIFSTGATTTSSAKGVTAATTYYSSGGEIYAQFTAAFPTAGGASSFQRIGIYDDNNGCFIGYEGTSFGVTTRKATVDTSVAQASFNVDTLTGAASSRFTRNGVPEAINLTYANVYRVRFGWLGEAPIVFEVLSPDGEWVVFHVIKQPNTSAAASLNNPELPVTCHVSKTAGATDYSIVTYCWGAGCTIAQRRATDSLTTSAIMDTTRAVIAGETTGGGGSLINVKVSPSGAVQAVATLAAGTDLVGSVKVSDGTTVATVRELGTNDALNVAIVDGSGNQITSFGGGATLFNVNTTITRPADTTAYAAGDAITDSTSAPTTASVTSVGSGNGAAIEIDSIIVTSTAKQSVLPYMRVFISNATFTATNDNSAFGLTDAENDAAVCQIDMGPPYYTANNARLERHDLGIVCNTGASDNKLYIALVADNAYTPVSGEVFKIIIRGRRL